MRKCWRGDSFLVDALLVGIMRKNPAALPGVLENKSFGQRLIPWDDEALGN
jgi:hypothetical protein